MQQVGQDDEGSEQRGEMLVAVAVVVFEVVAFCLKDVVVFVFDFPSGAAGGDDLCDMLVVDE